MVVYDKEKCISYYKNKYKYLKEDDLSIMYDSCYEIFLKTKYPSNYSIKEIPSNVLERNATWCLRAMQEMIERNGMTSAINYQENGITINFGRSGLSQSLIDEITPCANVGGY